MPLPRCLLNSLLFLGVLYRLLQLGLLLLLLFVLGRLLGLLLLLLLLLFVLGRLFGLLKLRLFGLAWLLGLLLRLSARARLLGLLALALILLFGWLLRLGMLLLLLRFRFLMFLLCKSWDYGSERQKQCRCSESC